MDMVHASREARLKYFVAETEVERMRPFGNGSEEESKLPVAVAGANRFRSLRAGGTATCAITLAGALLCWGLNTNGAVGQNNLGP